MPHLTVTFPTRNFCDKIRPMKNSKQFILFDNDGVLVHTEPLYYEANLKVFGEMGLEVDETAYHDIMIAGKSVFSVAEAKGFSPEEVAFWRDRRNDYYQDFIRSRDISIPGTDKVVEELAKRFRMGIVTTSRRVDFELIHEDPRFTRHMEFILCVEDYPRAKPYPDPYLAGLQAFHARPEQAVVVEDSERGLRAAVNAGIDCIVVHNSFTAHHDFSSASGQIPDLQRLLDIL